MRGFEYEVRDWFLLVLEFDFPLSISFEHLPPWSSKTVTLLNCTLAKFRHFKQTLLTGETFNLSTC